MPPEIAELLRWIEKADHDLRTAELALNLSRPCCNPQVDVVPELAGDASRRDELILAQRFNAGKTPTPPTKSRRDGRVPVSRPSGTYNVAASSTPAINRWANFAPCLRHGFGVHGG